MEGELLLRVVLLVPPNNQKPNLTLQSATRRSFWNKKIKANRKIIMGQREYIFKCPLVGICPPIVGIYHQNFNSRSFNLGTLNIVKTPKSKM